MIIDTEVQDELIRRHSAKIDLGKWNEIAKELNVNRGNLWKVWYGKSQSNKIRKALGLLPLGVICQCGKIHNSKCKSGKQIERLGQSIEPIYLFEIQKRIVPWLREREARYGK